MEAGSCDAEIVVGKEDAFACCTLGVAAWTQVGWDASWLTEAACVADLASVGVAENVLWRVDTGVVNAGGGGKTFVLQRTVTGETTLIVSTNPVTANLPSNAIGCIVARILRKALSR